MRVMHFVGNPDAPSFAACGRYLGTNARGRQTGDVNRVGCKDCKGKPAFLEALVQSKLDEEKAFEAQTPHHVREIFGGTTITCRTCGGDLFRDRPRSLDYNHHVCASCGTETDTLTETGASR